MPRSPYRPTPPGGPEDDTGVPAAARPGDDDAPLDDHDDDRPSKSQRKRDSHALQDLGEALVALPPSRLAAVELPERLREAVQAFLVTRSHEGRRRQMQFIGRLMRGLDVEPIRLAVLAHERGQAQDALALHEAERWRAELIARDEAMTDWLRQHPAADAQQLRTLVRNARKESPVPGSTGPGSSGGQPRKGRAYRELFQFIREAESAGQP